MFSLHQTSQKQHERNLEKFDIILNARKWNTISLKLQDIQGKSLLSRSYLNMLSTCNARLEVKIILW